MKSYTLPLIAGGIILLAATLPNFCKPEIGVALLVILCTKRMRTFLDGKNKEGFWSEDNELPRKRNSN